MEKKESDDTEDGKGLWSIETPDPQRLMGMGSLEGERGWLRGQDRVELNFPF